MLQDVVARPTGKCPTVIIRLSLLLLRFPKFHSFLFQVLDDGWILKMRGGGVEESAAALLEKFHRDIMLLFAPLQKWEVLVSWRDMTGDTRARPWQIPIIPLN